MDSVTAAWVDIRAHAEEMGRLVQLPLREAGRDGTHDGTPTETAIETALRSLTDPGSPWTGQRNGPSFTRVRFNLMREEIGEDDQDQRVRENHPLDDNDLMWYAPPGRAPVLAAHQALAPDLTSLTHGLHAHPGVESMLALIRERFHWSSIARDVREC